jgi:hypothetical protein
VATPAHEATTRHLGAAYPFAAEPGLGTPGVLVGRDLLGGLFTYDPFALYRRGLITNPNMLVVGQIGRGKSAFVKTYLWRQAVFGRRAWVLDPKGEYGPLARAMDVEPVALRPGGAVRLNPLDALAPDGLGPRGHDDDDHTVRRGAEVLASLASASLGRTLLPPERTALELAVAEASTGARRSGDYDRGRSPTLPSVVDELLDPSPDAARAVRTDVAGLAADGRHVALELRRLVEGDLRGMFDGPTSPGVDLHKRLGVLDLSAVYHSPALGVLMTCAAAWLQSGLGVGAPDTGGPAAGRNGVVVVVDEAWAILANLSAARWLQSSWKLSRAWGVANVAVVHRLSDLDAAGPAGSEQMHLAQGLLSDSETRVIYAQPHAEVQRAAGMLGLSSTEADLVPHLGRGVALWKVGTRSFLVQHRLSPLERPLVDTDAGMAGAVSAHQVPGGLDGAAGNR